MKKRRWIPRWPPWRALTSAEILDDALLFAIRQHRIPFARAGDVVLLEHGALGLRWTVHEHSRSDDQVMVVVEIAASGAAPGPFPVIETFAGVGRDVRAAIADAVVKFLLTAFHVLLEALTSHSCEKPQSEIESWGDATKRWRVYSGPTLFIQSEGAKLAEAYAAALPAIRQRFIAHADGGAHWLRVYVGSHGGKVQAFEALLDNEPWPPGIAALEEQRWQCAEGYSALRHFTLMLPQAE